MRLISHRVLGKEAYSSAADRVVTDVGDEEQAAGRVEVCFRRAVRGVGEAVQPDLFRAQGLRQGALAGQGIIHA